MNQAAIVKINRYRLLPLVLLALAAVATLVFGVWLIRSRAQSASNYEYFAETDHSIDGEFLSFFREHGGLEVFGFPITQQFLQDGRIVQYFQNVRLELRPENPPESRVQLTDIVSQMGFGDPPIPASSIPQNDPTRVYFSQSGHTVGLPFLRFYNDHGGAAVFGLPITEAVRVGRRDVQYFERASMDFDPERPPGQQVQLAELGMNHFVFAGIDPDWLRGVGPPAAFDATNPQPATSKVLRVDAQVGDPNAAAPGQQSLYVYVTDAQGHGVEDANVQFEVDFAGQTDSGEMQRTDVNGYTSALIPLKPVPAGQKIVIRVTASFGPLTDSASASFVPWQ